MKTINFKPLISIVLCFLFSGCITSEKKKVKPVIQDSISIKLEKYIEGHVSNTRFNGEILVAKKDSIIYSKSFGLANKETGIKNSDSTIYLIGSITKPFTAFGILLLENQGKLSLNERLSTYFPEFPDSKNVTIKQLLTHTSGITDYHAFSNWKEDSKLPLKPEQTMRKVAERPYIFAPGERFSYSNSGYILLGLIIEKVSELTFEEFIQKEILIPLNMNNTGVRMNGKEVKRLAKGYRTSPREIKNAEYINFNQPFSSGNMYSTPTDLWIFAQAVMHNTLLPKEKTESIFQVSDTYGYGWGLRNYNGVKAYGHNGAMNGFVGSMTYLPVEEYFVCFLTNDDNTPEHTISEDLVKIINGEKVTQPLRTKKIELNNKMKTAVIGEYLIKQGDTLKIFEDTERLYMQETGQIKHEIFPFDNYKFALTLFEFHIVFTDLKDGKAETLKFEGKNTLTAKRVIKKGKK